MVKYVCVHCDIFFSKKQGYDRHSKKHCPICNILGDNKFVLDSHMALVHGITNANVTHQLIEDKKRHKIETQIIPNNLQQQHGHRVNNNQGQQEGSLVPLIPINPTRTSSQQEEPTVQKLAPLQTSSDADLLIQNTPLCLEESTINKSNPETEKKNTTKYFCKDCNVYANVRYTHNRTTLHKLNVAKSISKNINEIKSCFKNRIATYEYLNLEKYLIPEDFLKEAREPLIQLLNLKLTEHTTIKFNLEMIAEYVKPVDEALNATLDKPSTSKRSTVMNDGICKPVVFNIISTMALATISDDIFHLYDKHATEIINKMSTFQEKDSGWSLKKMLKIEININKAAIQRGSSFLKTPLLLTRKHACINIQNNDVYCFKWCLIAALYGMCVNNPSITSSYNVNINDGIIILSNGIQLNFEGLEFPMALKDIKIFEANNSHISLNVFGYENGEVIGPYHLTKEEKINHVNLLMLHDDDKFHYIWIKDMSR